MHKHDRECLLTRAFFRCILSLRTSDLIFTERRDLMEFRIPVVNQWNWLIVGINGLLTASGRYGVWRIFSIRRKRLRRNFSEWASLSQSHIWMPSPSSTFKSPSSGAPDAPVTDAIVSAVRCEPVPAERTKPWQAAPFCGCFFSCFKGAGFRAGALLFWRIRMKRTVKTSPGGRHISVYWLSCLWKRRSILSVWIRSMRRWNRKWWKRHNCQWWAEREGRSKKKKNRHRWEGNMARQVVL